MIGKRIRSLRKAKNMSLSELAKRAGVSKSYLSFIERDLSNNPSVHFLDKIAMVLDVPINSVLSSEEKFDEEFDSEWYELTEEVISLGITKQELRSFIEFKKWSMREAQKPWE